MCFIELNNLFEDNYYTVAKTFKKEKTDYYYRGIIVIISSISYNLLKKINATHRKVTYSNSLWDRLIVFKFNKDSIIKKQNP